MPSRFARHSFLACTIAALSLASLPGWAFYMPSEFDIDATPGQNASASHTHPDTTAVFDYQNHTRTVVENDTTTRSTHTSPAPTSAATAVMAEGAAGRAALLLPRDVWSPPILAPDAGTVWKVGSTVKVVWDTSTRPKHVTNYNGKVVLGYLEDGDETNEHLNFGHPLAVGFNLTQGHVTVSVPDVPSSNEYIVVLFGDSGNRSPTFTIVN